MFRLATCAQIFCVAKGDVRTDALDFNAIAVGQGRAKQAGIPNNYNSENPVKFEYLIYY